MILPRDAQRATSFARPPARQDLAPGAPGSKRALVLEPFANSLTGGTSYEAEEVKALTQAGFSVDVLRNSAVTVSALEKLATYSFVYMETHSNTWAAGDAVVMTGETDSKPYVPLFVDGSVVQTTVEGQSQNQFFNAVTSTFFKLHVGKFPDSSMLFFNGCDLLPATAFWKVLQTKYVATMLAWNGFALDTAAEPAGEFVLARLWAGDTVADAIAAARDIGLADSKTPDGTVGHLGYLGDGTNTLAKALTGAAPGPTATPGPTTTATPAVASYLSVGLIGRVRPGSHQVVQVTASPGAEVRIRVMYPNGDHQSAAMTADGKGKTRYSYVQAASKITHDHLQAVVQVTAQTKRAVVIQQAHYRILFAPIDVSVEPRQQSAGGKVNIWVHTKPGNRPITVSLSSASGTDTELRGRSNGGGWAHLVYIVPVAPPGDKTVVSAELQDGTHTSSTRSAFVTT
jgi:hypothetical protein